MLCFSYQVYNLNILTHSESSYSSKPCRNLSPRRRMKLTNRLLTALLIILLVVLVCLHLVILPAVSGGYNDECYLSDEKRQTLRIMVQNISRAFDEYGVQYWLDYGEFCCHVSMVYIVTFDNKYIYFGGCICRPARIIRRVARFMLQRKHGNKQIFLS